MSSINSMATTNNNNNNNDKAKYLPDEWVEIIEPRTKQRIYANLDTGICAKDPPEGAIVSKSEDYKDHWWELYDQKTGKYYYYNPEQQKTVWSKPKEAITNGKSKEKKKLLIIPVSRLQTFKKVSHNEQSSDKCDASTQTIASNLVSTSTQTISESVLEDEFNDKLKFIDLSNESSKSSSSCTHSISNNIKSTKLLNHRQISDFNGRDRTTEAKSQYYRLEHRNINSLQEPHFRYTKNQEPTKDINKSSQHDDLYNQSEINPSDFPSYFGIYQGGERPPISIKSPSRYTRARLKDDYMTSTSTFANHSSKPPISSNNNNNNEAQRKLTTNNLSHYLVREARAMGIALISDDEIDDDDQDSDEECIVDEDDDLSSHRDDMNESQDLGEESSEGWKSFSDPDSPNSVAPKSIRSSIQKSPLHCETSESFTFNNLIDDEKNPASCMSQQLDHQKLVDNFKKSRQSSSFGIQDSLARAHKLDSNQAIQRIKTVADSYLNESSKDNQMSDRHLRQLSTLSTLPRPHKETKDRIALSKQEDNNIDATLDADYDVVEENCGYYSDTDKKQFNNSHDSNKSSTKLLGEPKIQINSNFDRNKSSRGSTFSVESFARENLTRHPKKGSLLFNRKVKWSRMITWTKSSIKQPMISSVSSDCNADAIASFKLIQQFMSDRKVTITKKYKQILVEAGVSEDTIGKVKSLARSSSISSSSKDGHNLDSSFTIPDRLRDELAYELIVRGCSKSSLRDEIYIQLARQLTENPNQESIRWGLVLMSIILSYFSPSSKFSPFLLSFLEGHTHQMAQDVCLPRLEKRLRQNWLTYCRKPADGREISIIRLSITKWPQYCGVFGESLEHLMSLQSCSPHLKTLRLPWILTTLGDKLLETGGAETEGIFRCAADHDLIAQLKLEIDCVDFRKITDAKLVHSLLSNVTDPHVIAGLLKLFFRQLYEPVFPMSIYDMCLQNSHDGHMACRIFNEHLPNLNKDVVAYLIRLLQTLSHNDNVTFTKMDNSNLSMVWAPNLLRSPNSQQFDNNMGSQQLIVNNGSKNGSKWSISNGQSNEDNSTSSNNMAQVVSTTQSSIFEQTRQEMQFIRSLIIHLDTSFIENVI